jgi:hypothetical protein
MRGFGARLVALALLSTTVWDQGAAGSEYQADTNTTGLQASGSVASGLDLIFKDGFEATGAAQIGWLVNGGQNCPTNPAATVTITASGGPTSAQGSAACSAYSLVIAGLAPGTYSFDLTLTDPDHVGQAATGSASGISVAAGATTVVADVPIICSFCPQ